MEFLSQTEADKYAESLHPDGKALVENHKWYIIIPTPFFKEDTLPEKFELTPASKLYKQPSIRFVNKLYEWANEEDLEGQDVTIIAEIYNLKDSVKTKSQKRHVELLKQNKIPTRKSTILKTKNEEDAIQLIATWLELKKSSLVRGKCHSSRTNRQPVIIIEREIK